MRDRTHIHLPKDPGDFLADIVVTAMGSWKFIICQTIIVSLWVLANILVLIKHYDPYPFILLNLVFSTQAAYASPLILMASNRQSNKDRVRDDTEAKEVDELLTIQATQLGLLTAIRDLSQEIHSNAVGK